MTFKGIEQLADESHHLINLSIEVTEKCNLKCVHCYVADRSKKKKLQILRLDDIERTLRQAKDMNVLKITITGGEPFCHPQIRNILFLIKKYGFICYVLSNGTLINEENIDVIKRCVHKVFLSNYGFSSYTYENAARTPGAYNFYCKAKQLLEANGVPYEERIILLKENEIDIDAFVASECRIETCICGEKNNGYAEVHRPSTQAIRKAIKSTDNAKEVIRHRFESVCNLGKTSVTIKANGDITPCNGLYLKLGNIENNLLEEVWNGELLLKLAKKTNFHNFKECIKCKYRNYSQYILPCNNYQENGDLNLPSKETCRHCKVYFEISKNKG